MSRVEIRKRYIPSLHFDARTRPNAGDRRRIVARSPPRVLVVTPRYLPDTGGVERHVYETARRLADRGFDLTVLTTDRTRRRARHEQVDGITIQRVPAWPGGRDYYIAPAIYRGVTDGSWDLVHVQSWHTPVAPLAMLAATKRNIPYVVTPHGRGYASPLRRPFRPLQRRMLRPLLLRSKQVIALARFEQDLLIRELKLPPSLVTVIPNGGDLRPPTDSAPAPHTPIIASVGRLERFKGHHRVIEALPHVLAQRPDVQLVIAGEGPYESTLRRLSRKLGVEDRISIEFFPMADRDRLAAMVSQASLVVLLSEYETHPVAALEAAALGRQLLVADVAGLRELADDGLARAVPLATSPHDLAAAMLDALENPSSPPSFELPSWDDCVDGLLRVYMQHAA